MDVAKGQERLLGRVGIGRLRIVDEYDPAKSADLLHPMSEPGKGQEGAGDALGLDAERPRGGVGERRVLPVVGAAKRPRRLKIGRRRGLYARHHPVFADPDVGERRFLARYRDDARRAGARFEPRVDFAARLVVDADQGDVGMGDQALLHRRVAGKVAVPVEMVGGDVDKEADARRERGGEIDLIGRALDDVRPPGCGRRQVKHGHADVASHRHLATGFLQHVGDQRGGGRLAVGAGDGDERRIGRPRTALASEELDVADDRNPGLIGKIDRPVWRRVGQGHAGGKHEEPEPAPVGLSEVDDRNSRSGSAFASGGAIVPGGDFGAALDQRSGGRQTRAAEAEEGDALSAHGFDRRHRHLSLSEARPTIANTKAMIQNRMTICGSDQPSCSK